jgi:hypothetical protein
VREYYRNGDPITLIQQGCDGCSPSTVIGVLVHEAGCPYAYKDDVETDTRPCKGVVEVSLDDIIDNDRDDLYLKFQSHLISNGHIPPGGEISEVEFEVVGHDLDNNLKIEVTAALEYPV